MKCIVEVISDTLSKPNPLPISEECLETLRGGTGSDLTLDISKSRSGRDTSRGWSMLHGPDKGSLTHSPSLWSPHKAAPGPRSRDGVTAEPRPCIVLAPQLGQALGGMKLPGFHGTWDLPVTLTTRLRDVAADQAKGEKRVNEEGCGIWGCF